MSAGVLALVVEFRILPDRVAEFDAAIVENARASLECEPGCRRFDVCRDAADACLFFLYELYDDEEAIRAHLESAHYLRMNALTQPWVESKVVRRYALRY